MKKFIYFALTVTGVLASSLLMAELGLRLYESRFGITRGSAVYQGPISRALVAKVFGRFERLWLTPAELKPYPFRPPYDIFVNRGAEDPVRMAEIARHALEPKGRTWRAENFLLPPELAKDSAYEVTINEMGFRDSRHSLQKSKGTFRAVAYGAYTTFGFGVQDQDSYVRVLERSLNADSKVKRQRFEIWNGGRPGYTAIMGLARLESEYEQLKPDLLIWDFGLVDMALRFDANPLGPKQLYTSPAPLLYHLVKAVCPRSETYPIEICIRSVEWLSRVSRNDALEGWRDVNRRMVEFAKAHRLPVIMLRHFNFGIPPEEYEKLADPAHGIYFVDTSAETSRPPPPEIIKEFWSHPNWTAESGTEASEITAHHPVAFALLDAIQFNSRGHAIIARLLQDKIHEAVSNR